MERNSIVYALGQVDEEYIMEAAPNIEKKVGKNRNGWSIIAACITLVVVLGTSAFAAGILDPLFSYFRSEEEIYFEEILAPAEMVSNENVQIRLEGVIADDSTCYMVVSLIGLSVAEKKQIEKADIRHEIEIYGLFENGERIMGDRKSAATYMQGEKAKSLFPDATRTSVIAYSPKTCGISDVEKVCFSYGGLVLEVLPEDYLTSCYKLDSGNNEDVSDIQISRVGFSFMQSVSEGNELEDFVYEIRLIRNDGTVLTAEEMREIGYSHDFSVGADTNETKITGNWGQMPSITMINLDDYLGLQINGDNYYYTTP